MGEAICRRLANEGYDVSVCDVLQDQGEDVARDIGGSFILTDVSDPEAVRSAVNAVVENHTRLDALVNCAGIVGSQKPIGAYDVDEWHRVLDVNVNGTFFGLKFGLEQMSRQETGGRSTCARLLAFVAFATWDLMWRQNSRSGA